MVLGVRVGLTLGLEVMRGVGTAVGETERVAVGTRVEGAEVGM